MKLAVAGKGGVGKTFIAGALARTYAVTGRSVLAIDADPAPNLALMLGLGPEEASRILPVSENCDLIESKTKTPYPGVFNLSFSVDDIIRDYTTRTPSGVNLMVVGTVKEWGSGCACPASSVVRTLLSRMVTMGEDIVIIDLEAGLEHLGRATTEHVDLMLVVTDATPAALMIAGRICELAGNSGIRQVMLVGNRVATGQETAIIRAFAEERSLRVAGMIPYDSIVRQADMGRSGTIRKDSPAYAAVAELASALIAGIPENATDA
jgi:CO dehydrogenase maturation factor